MAKVTSYIYSSLYQNQSIAAISLDIVEAFDTMNNKIPLEKIESVLGV